jgi:uncharacterized membrane protein YcaP (DUF421 family)
MDAIFGSGQDLAWYQECARAVLIFAFGLALVRLAGRRIFGKWSALDIIVSMMIGSNLSRALTGSAQLWGTLVATLLLVCLHWVLARLASASYSLSQLFEGRDVKLAESGNAREEVLRRYAVSEADLSEALRQAGVTEVAATRVVTLEPSGKITVLK